MMDSFKIRETRKLLNLAHRPKSSCRLQGFPRNGGILSHSDTKLWANCKMLQMSRFWGFVFDGQLSKILGDCET